MSLPEFDHRRLLPDGVHLADQAALHDRCVVGVPSSNTRKQVFDGFCRYQAALAALGLNVTQWVDGSFVDASRQDPEDVDLVNFSKHDELNGLHPADQMNARQLMNGREATKRAYACHTFLAVVFPDGHPFAANADAMRRYWREFFSRARDYRYPDKPHAPWRGRKGFAEMHVGVANLCPSVSHAY